MASHPAVPSWIETRTGQAPLLLLAPHGGRRHALREPGRHKVNDLHTAALTRALAASCDATSLVNATQDRNEIDLNRITQVRRSAPWLPTILAALLEEMVERAGHATVLVLHGWNVVQPVCDVGIGATETAEGIVPVRAGSCTATPRFVDEILPRLRDELAPAGVVVTLGARYPAAHPNNLLQVFTPAGADDRDPAFRRLGSLARSGAIDAAQIELGIPLRWPGPGRDALLAGLTRVFGPGGIGVSTPPAPRSGLACGGRIDRRRTLQFVSDDLVGLSGIEGDQRGGIAGRLLLSAEPDRLALFTGELAERAGVPWHVPPLRFAERADGAWEIRYAGPLLSFPMLTPFLDLENGLAHGDLLDADVALTFAPLHAPDAAASCAARFGTLQGAILLGGRRFDVRTAAILGDGSGQSAKSLPSLRLVLPDGPAGHLELFSSAVERAAPDLRFALDGYACAGHQHGRLVGSANVTLDGVHGLLELELPDGHGTLRRAEGRLARLIPVRRPGRPGTVVHTTYALCRLDGHAGGWLELSVEHALPSDGLTPPAT